MKSLTQRRFFKQKQFTVTASSLTYEVHTPGQSQSYDISYEHLHKVVLTDKRSRIELLILGLAMLGLGTTSYFDGHVVAGANAFFEWSLLGSGLLMLLFYLFGATSYLKLKLSDNQYVVLYKSKPDAMAVENFIHHLYEERDAYLINEYGTINTRLTYNYQLEQFKRLRRLQVWTEAEFKEKCQELEGMHRLMDMGFDLGSKVNQN